MRFRRAGARRVNVQAMVFGNMGDDCATGVCFSRNPANGENAFYGEYLVNAQGEDVVAGIRTPQNLTKLEAKCRQVICRPWKKTMPEDFRNLCDIRDTLERTTKTCRTWNSRSSRQPLWMLQTRSGKRTGQSGVEDRLRYGR